MSGHGNVEAIVEQRKGLQRCQSLMPTRSALRRVCTVQRGHERIRLASHDEPVNAATVRTNVFRIKLVVFVMRRMFGLLQFEQIKAWPFHFQVQLSADGQDGVADFLGFQSPAIHSPQKLVVSINRFCIGVALRSLTIRGTGDDQTMQILERLTILQEVARQPVEQFRMAGLLAHAAEVVRRIHNRATEVILPDSIHDRTPGQRMIVLSDPLCQRRAASRFGMIGRQRELPCVSGSQRNCTGRHGRTRLRFVASMQHSDAARHAVCGFEISLRSKACGSGVNHATLR